MNQSKHRSFIFRWLISSVLLITSSCQFLGFGQSENACGPSTLTVGEAVYEIKAIKPKSDVSLNIPANQPDNAFWVEGTTTNQVFGLSPTENNLALASSLKTGDTVRVNWENCNTADYQLSTLQPGIPEDSLLDQSVAQVTIFVRSDDPSAGFVAIAELTEETINVSNTPDTSIPQAEISVLNTTASADGQTVEINVSIVNYGESAFTLSAADTSFVSENTELKLNSSDPALPHEIKPAETATFKLIFPHPTSQTATLKILTVEYEISGY
jgi:hypothetical protein